MTGEELERGQRTWLAMRRAGEGSEEWRQAEDHWVAWMREHAVELMNLAAEKLGAGTLVDRPQALKTVAPPPDEPHWRKDPVIERMLAKTAERKA